MRIRSLLLANVLAPLFLAPAAFAEFYVWTDEAGRTHYSDQPGEGAARVEVDQRRVQMNAASGSQDAEPSEAVKRAREKRREIQRWADRQPSKRRESVRRRGPLRQVVPSPNGGHYSPISRETADARREAECQRVYGKSCAALDDWKKQATADCTRRNVSQDCSSEDYLAKQRPRTLEQKAEIEAKRDKRRERRIRKVEREIDALRRR